MIKLPVVLQQAKKGTPELCAHIAERGETSQEMAT
jgi:hypothetical protein